MKPILLAAAVLFTTQAFAGKSNFPADVPRSKISAEQAVAKVVRQWGFDPAKHHLRLVAVVWSPLTCTAGANPPHCYYVEPLSGHHLNLCLAGEPKEWSWFVTYVGPHPKPRPPGRKHDLCTFQVRENGEVNGLR
jgi:hypothetical protein